MQTVEEEKWMLKIVCKKMEYIQKSSLLIRSHIYALKLYKWMFCARTGCICGINLDVFAQNLLIMRVNKAFVGAKLHKYTSQIVECKYTMMHLWLSASIPSPSILHKIHHLHTLNFYTF